MAKIAKDKTDISTLTQQIIALSRCVVKAMADA